MPDVRRYNWQFSPLIVLGFEADIQGTDISGRGSSTGTATESFVDQNFASGATAICSTSGGCSNAATFGTAFLKTAVTANSVEVLMATFTNAAISANGFNSVTSDLDWLGTVRGRLGYLITPNLLLYATGGLAYGEVSASTSFTTNFNFSADSFALAYTQAIGAPATATLAATTEAAGVAAAFGNGTTPNTHTLASVSQPFVSTATASCSNPCTTAANSTTPPAPILTSLATASRPTSGESNTSFAQAATNLSAALATTQRSVHVSDTRFGGTVGGGFEWMMAQNWSFKAEALYYDLGSVTISTPVTALLNPLTAAIPATVGGVSIATVTNQINKFAGAATVSNVATTHVNFQGVILRVGLNYHFNLM